MTSTQSSSQDSTAVWYFIAATFIFALPNIFFGDLPWWARVAFLVLGLLVVTAGGFQWRREAMQKRRTGSGDVDTAGGEPPPA